MKVVFKFALVFFVASCLCLGASSYFLAQREAIRLEESVAEDLLDYGLGTARALEGSWRESDLAHAEKLLKLFQAQGDVELRLSTEPIDHPIISSTPNETTRRVLVRVPVSGPDARRATLELARNAPNRNALLRAELGAELMTAFVMALAMALIAAVLGLIVIGRPLGRIVEQARRIGEGDFTHRLRADRTDEIGALKRELNAMCDQLVAATARAEEEASARAEALEQMRHLDRLRTAGTIATSIAHELGTPLNILLLRGQSLAMEPHESSDVVAAGKTVVGQVQKMTTIVRQLLDFTRAKNVSAENMSETDVAQLVGRATALLDGIAKKHQIKLRVTAHDPAIVQGRPQQLEQALTNLIVNAIHASNKGGVIDIEIATVDVAGALPSVRIAVKDHGHGMNEETVKRIFEPFFTTKDPGVGTGLGLHVARGIVTDHAGTLSVESVVGEGTTFIISLPRIV